MGLQILDGGEAFYFLNEGGHLQGAVITHFDYFNLVGTEEFVQKLITHVEQELTV